MGVFGSSRRLRRLPSLSFISVLGGAPGRPATRRNQIPTRLKSGWISGFHYADLDLQIGFADLFRDCRVEAGRDEVWTFKDGGDRPGRENVAGCTLSGQAASSPSVFFFFFNFFFLAFSKDGPQVHYCPLSGLEEELQPVEGKARPLC